LLRENHSQSFRDWASGQVCTVPITRMQTRGQKLDRGQELRGKLQHLILFLLQA
jgi:hypothetical protein